VLRVTYIACGSVKYVPRSPPRCRRYSLACSSDQKKIDFLQNASMMLGSSSLPKFTMGA
jgi:hypothetical protein